jgi:hypothetical protein
MKDERRITGSRARTPAAVQRANTLGQPQPSVEIHIEELVLHGFSPHARFRVAEAVQQELARLVFQEGVPASMLKSMEVDGLDGGAFTLAPAARDQGMGKQVARAIYGGLAR